MKYCLSSRQTKEYLKKADEIKVKYRDRDIIYDFSQDYEGKTIILEFPLDRNIIIDWKEIEKYNTVCQGNLILCVATMDHVREAKGRGMKFYYGFPINSFYDLQALKKLGVCYVRLGAPLFFNMDKVKQIGIPVRAIPNVAHEGYFPRENGVFGQWIRPEDMELYADYIAAIEFEDADLQKERALYRIYCEEKNWPGEMNMIITNMNYQCLNRLVSEKVGQARLNCGQRCQSGGACRICERYLYLAKEEVMRKIADKVKAQKEKKD